MKTVLKDALVAAKGLLGYKLVYETPDGRISGYIVETEAYMQGDPASHSTKGRTSRTEPMFGTPGTIYVYFTYGMHYCMNIVTGEKDHGQAVLIRALQPVDGIEIMKLNRKTQSEFKLINGPGKLCQALGIDKSLSGSHIDNGPLKLEKGLEVVESNIVTSTRIGIRRAVDMPWRFYIKDNPYVSRL